jgi:uncharacterized membrane protein YfcA
MSAAALITALVVTFVAAAIQGVVGMGFAMVSVPILALIDPSLAPVPQLLITLPLTVSMAWRERRHIQLSGVGWIIGGRIPGAVIGIGLLAVATQQTLDIAIALIVLGAVAIIASGFHVKRTPFSEFGAGLAAGLRSRRLDRRPSLGAPLHERRRPDRAVQSCDDLHDRPRDHNLGAGIDGEHHAV